MQSQAPLFYALIAFWYALAMSAIGFILFCYLEIRSENRLRDVERRRDHTYPLGSGRPLN